MTHQTTRRDFLKTTTAAGVAWWVGSEFSHAQDSKNPVERLNFACIGVQGKGSSDTSDAGRNGNVVALVDIDEKRLAKKAAEFSKAEQFVDYREMYDKLGDKIDAVTVSTPDHSHAAASVMGMKLGKNCFCQKPLTWSIHEARVMRELAAKKGVATQMGNQGTANNALREAVEVVKSGGIGEVREVHVWTNRPVWPQAKGRPDKVDPVPPFLHWDLFLGPAPERPYAEDTYHPFKWRGWLDFGTGALGDMACHTMNMPVMAVDLFEPVSVVADHTGIVENETYPAQSTITFEFPERKGVPLSDSDDAPTLPPCTMTWYDGGRRPADDKFPEGVKKTRSGALVIGSKGTIFSGDDYCGRYGLYPKAKYETYEKPEQVLPRTGNHFREFADYCRDRSKKSMSNFDYAGRLTETLLIGNLALRAGSGTKLAWDARNLKVTNVEEANQWVGRTYREGWSL